ncbi:hypothetical protein [Streptomyces sp. NPDC058486]|uniref:hypothetical protein n=1 Tax=unclassified Streptomyces TaxID=2593676 RepID=UPI00365D6FD0
MDSSSSLLWGLGANPALPSELVDRLISVADDVLSSVLAHRPDLSSAQALTLARRVEWAEVSLAYEGGLTAADIDPAEWPYAALALLDQEAAPASWARLLVADPDPERREKLAGCPGLPADVTERLAADPVLDVVVELALCGPAEWAARLAVHPHTSVRHAVANNETAPPAVLAALLTDEGLPPVRHCRACDPEDPPSPGAADAFSDRFLGFGRDLPAAHGGSCDGSHASAVHSLREAVLRNPATPAEAAARFAWDGSWDLRLAMAERVDLPGEACARLAGDPDSRIRAALAENPALDAALARRLAGDPAAKVRRALAHNPRVPLDVLVSLARTDRIAGALLPRVATASAAETEALVSSADPAARALVAQRRDLPPEARDRLARDADAKVVAAVAPHPGLSEDMLRAMLGRHGVQVLAGVAANPDATPAVLEEVVRHEPGARKALYEVARHHAATPAALLVCLEDSRARPLAAAHPALPPAVIVGLVVDEGEAGDVREAAAAHPSLPVAVMADLLREL